MLGRMKEALFSVIRLHLRAGHNLTRNYGVEVAGYLTFLALLSLFPYLLLMVSAAGAMGQGETGRQLIETILQHLPPEAVKTIRPRVIEIISGPPHGILTFAILSALWTSSSAIEAMRKMLNRAYHVRAQPKYFARRMLSIAQVILFTLASILIMAFFVLAPIATHYFTELTGIGVPIKLAGFMNSYFLLLGMGALFVTVYSLYYVLPNVQQTRRDVFPGALLVVGLWLAGGKAVSLYLTNIMRLTLVYGSLSGFIATLIFFYVMILIFIYGAEFNHELALKRGKLIEEDEPGLTPESQH